MCFCPIHCFIVKFFLFNKNSFLHQRLQQHDSSHEHLVVRRELVHRPPLLSEDDPRGGPDRHPAGNQPAGVAATRTGQSADVTLQNVAEVERDRQLAEVQRKN